MDLILIKPFKAALGLHLSIVTTEGSKVKGKNKKSGTSLKVFWVLGNSRP